MDSESDVICCISITEGQQESDVYECTEEQHTCLKPSVIPHLHFMTPKSEPATTQLPLCQG